MKQERGIYDQRVNCILIACLHGGLRAPHVEGCCGRHGMCHSHCAEVSGIGWACRCPTHISHVARTEARLVAIARGSTQFRTLSAENPALPSVMFGNLMAISHDSR